MPENLIPEDSPQPKTLTKERDDVALLLDAVATCWSDSVEPPNRRAAQERVTELLRSIREQLAEASTLRDELGKANKLLDKDIQLRHANISEPLTFSVRYLASTDFEIGASPEVDALRDENARLRADREALVDGQVWWATDRDSGKREWFIGHGGQPFATADEALAYHASRITELDNG